MPINPDIPNTQKWTASGGEPRHTDEYLADLNTVLRWPRTTAVGAYSIAYVEVLVFQTLGIVPTRYLLEKVAECSTLADAVKIADEWIADCRFVEQTQSASLEFEWCPTCHRKWRVGQPESHSPKCRAALAKARGETDAK